MFIFVHFELDHWKSAVIPHDSIREFIKEFIRGKPQSILHPEDVIRGEGQMELGTALGETGDISVAFEKECVSLDGPKYVVRFGSIHCLSSIPLV